MLDINLIHVVTTSITDKAKCLNPDLIKIQTKRLHKGSLEFPSSERFYQHILDLWNFGVSLKK